MAALLSLVTWGAMGVGVGAVNWMLEKNHTSKLWWLGQTSNFSCNETARMFVQLQDGLRAMETCDDALYTEYWEALRNTNDMFGWAIYTANREVRLESSHVTNMRGCARRAAIHLTEFLKLICDPNDYEEASKTVATIDKLLEGHVTNMQGRLR